VLDRRPARRRCLGLLRRCTAHVRSGLQAGSATATATAIAIAIAIATATATVTAIATATATAATTAWSCHAWAAFYARVCGAAGFRSRGWTGL
jgi:hypothetical protein